MICALCCVPLPTAIEAGGPGMFFSAKLAVIARPEIEAVTVKLPVVKLAVNGMEVATPEALVTAVLLPPEKAPLAPLPGAVNVTVTPLTGLPLASSTVTASAAPNTVLICAVCGVPPLAAMVAGGPMGRFTLVSEKVAGVETPGAVAVAMKLPNTPLAVKAGDTATPEALVTAVFTPPAKAPLAPLDGTLKVTVTFGAGLPFASRTVAIKGDPKAVLMGAFCGVPPVAVIEG